MAAQPIPPAATGLELKLEATFSNLRALAWAGDWLYASRGYELLRARVGEGEVDWQHVGRYHSQWWRTWSCRSRLGARLLRDGFHALAVLSSGQMVAAVPGAIVTLFPGTDQFRVSHHVTRGTRPLHIAATPDGNLLWGEYFDNQQRDEVHIYASRDQGATWQVAHTFAKGEIRHVHNIVHDPWENCLWILTGDIGSECRILRASCDLRTVDVILSGTQQARAVALVPTPDALYFSSDTPLEANHIFRMDHRGNVETVADLPNSSIYGTGVGDAVFFSTMVEPSAVNRSQLSTLIGSMDGSNWQRLLEWKKDRWPMGLFQYGNTFLPDGRNTSDVLALTTIAVEHADQQTTLWRVRRSPML